MFVLRFLSMWVNRPLDGRVTRCCYQQHGADGERARTPFIMYRVTVEAGDSLQKARLIGLPSVCRGELLGCGGLPGHHRCPRTSGVRPRSPRSPPTPEGPPLQDLSEPSLANVSSEE